MTSKEKLIGRAQRVQVAAQAAGGAVQLTLNETGVEITALATVGYSRIYQVYVPYSACDKLQEALLGGIEAYELEARGKGGVTC